MRLTVLGSGNADAQADRACAGYLLETPDPILLDFGPGTWRNLAKTGVAAASIRTILLSHHHPDHFSDLVPFLFQQHWAVKDDRRPPLAVFGPPGTEAIVDGIRRTIPNLNDHAFPIEIRDMDSGEVKLGDVVIRPRVVPHVDKLTALAWRVEAGGKRFVYSGDCRSSDDTAAALEGADLAVVEATYPDGRPSRSHLTVGEACELASKAGVKRLVLSHFSPRWAGRDPVKECAGRFPGELHAARDLFSLSF